LRLRQKGKKKEEEMDVFKVYYTRTIELNYRVASVKFIVTCLRELAMGGEGTGQKLGRLVI